MKIKIKDVSVLINVMYVDAYVKYEQTLQVMLDYKSLNENFNNICNKMPIRI